MTALVRSTSFSGGNYGGTTTLAWPVGITAADVVYAVVFNGGGSLPAPPGWVPILANGSTLIFRHVYLAGDAAPAWVHSAGSDQWDFTLIAVSGLDNATPEDSAATTYANYIGTTTGTSAVNVAAVSGSLVLECLTGFGNGSTVSGTGLTALPDNNHLHVLSAAPAVIGSYAGPTITFAVDQGSAYFQVSALALRPAGVAIYQYGPTAAAVAPATTPGGRLVRSPDNARWLTESRPNRLDRRNTAYMLAPNVFSRCKHYSNNVTTPQLTSRTQHVALFDAVDVRLVFGNVHGQASTSGLGDLTISAVFEAPNGNGSNQSASRTWRLRFNGRLTGVVSPGGYIKSDPIPLHIIKGNPYFVRTFITVAGGTDVPLNRTGTNASRFEFSDATTTTDRTDTSNTIANVNSPGLYGPCAVEATPLGRSQLPMVVGCGDSILEGVSRFELFSWFDQIMELARVPHLKVSMSGEQNIDFFGQPFNTLDSVGREFRGRFLAGATDILSNSSINDIIGGAATFAQMQQRVLNAASISAYYGARFHQTTITPNTASTDGWKSLAGQTISNAGNEASRSQTNAWLRDGAPVTRGTLAAMPTGDATATTIRVGTYGHPIAGIFDAAATVEVLFGGNLIWSINAITTDGLHPGDSGHNMIASAFSTYSSTRFAAPSDT